MTSWSIKIRGHERSWSRWGHLIGKDSDQPWWSAYDISYRNQERSSLIMTWWSRLLIIAYSLDYTNLNLSIPLNFVGLVYPQFRKKRVTNRAFWYFLIEWMARLSDTFWVVPCSEPGRVIEVKGAGQMESVMYETWQTQTWPASSLPDPPAHCLLLGARKAGFADWLKFAIWILNANLFRKLKVQCYLSNHFPQLLWFETTI